MKALDSSPQDQKDSGAGQNVKAQQQQEGGLKRKQPEEEGDSEDDVSYEQVLKGYVAREEVWLRRWIPMMKLLIQRDLRQGCTALMIITNV